MFGLGISTVQWNMYHQLRLLGTSCYLSVESWMWVHSENLRAMQGSHTGWMQEFRERMGGGGSIMDSIMMVGKGSCSLATGI